MGNSGNSITMFQKWNLTIWITLAAAISSLLTFYLGGETTDPPTLVLSEEKVLFTLRFSARFSLAIFCIVFLSGPIHRTWPHLYSRWLMKNRRYLGVAFSGAFAVHLAWILVRAIAFPAPFLARIAPTTIIFGSAAYILCLLMTLSSSNAAVKRLGKPRWKTLHTIGMWVFFIVFINTILPDFLEFSPFHIVAVIMLSLGAALRIRELFTRKKS